MNNIPRSDPMLPSSRVSSITPLFWRSAKIFLPLYAIGLFTLLLSVPIASLSGTKPDVATTEKFGAVLAMIFIVLVVLAILAKFICMIFIEKPDSPSKELIRWVKDGITRENRPFNLFHLVTAISLFLAGFAVLKGAIAVINPFTWDPTLLVWERWLHFGTLPHEWLAFMVNSRMMVGVLNFFYNLWYFIILASLLAAGIYLPRRPCHIQYLISFMVTWLIGGFFIALIFSSAGPCYFERAGFGTEYLPLMRALTEASNSVPVWALPTQDLLWNGYIGKQPGSAGIAAFPSLHVANAVLIALYAGNINRFLTIAGWIFAGAILLGSIVLAWHYAIDSYAGAALALLVWKFTTKIMPVARG